MKKVLIVGSFVEVAALAVALAVSVPAVAGAVIVDTDPVLEFVKEKAAESLFGPQVSFSGVAGFGATLPIYTIHNRKTGQDRIEYALIGIGYGRLEGGEDRLQADVLFDLIGISNKLWKQWLGDRVDVTRLPPVKFGPVLQAPDLNRLKQAWVIGDRSGLRVVYRFGSK